MKFKVGDIVQIQMDLSDGSLKCGTLVKITHANEGIGFYVVTRTADPGVEWVVDEDNVDLPVILPMGYVGEDRTCSHDWHLYTGLQDKFYYCSKCDEKCECSS